MARYLRLEEVFVFIECLGRSCGRWENLMWGSGLCDWSRGCMPMRGSVFVLVRGTVMSLKWRSMFTKARYSARCSSSSCLKPCHARSALGSPGRTSTRMALLSSLNHSRNVSGGSWLEKKQWRRKTESKGRKDEDHDLWYEPGPPAEFRRLSMRRLVCRTGVGSNSIFCNGCKHWVHKVCSWLMCLTKRPWLQMGGRKQREVLAWQAGGGSFFLLPRRHALSSWWLWTFNNNTWKPSGKSALTPPPPPTLVYSTDRSKAMVPVLVLLFVALWFILRGDLF